MDEFDRELFTFAPPAVGLFLLGVASLLAPRLGFAWRLAVSGLAVTGVYGSLVVVFDQPNLYDYPAASLAGTAVAVLFIRLADRFALCNLVRTPLGYGTAFSVLGLAGLGGCYWHHEVKASLFDSQEMDHFQILTYLPERTPIGNVTAVTDRGYPIPLSHARTPRPKAETTRIENEALAALTLGNATIRRQPANDDSNCHGWVFTGGRYIVPGSVVGQILQDNGYAVVTTPSPGDLIVYRNSSAEVMHTAIVRYVAPGRPPMVEGKLGWMGVYLHCADECCYGTNYTFHRSRRDGDLLKGIGGSTGVHFTGAE
ncbi:hypothetical protein [Limnoglobus roseus]|uniref:CHAP domain-containing protein n=1 Tax=Limnoglobus roseus TaxID=2598579 RepID=A0A5C1AD12_9BACT|nr:hypothetical protein [Limnoglobus roseus]QEL16590.1 CHAP domain-containing protein [Limnoglobus roseus]